MSDETTRYSLSKGRIEAEPIRLGSGSIDPRPVPRYERITYGTATVFIAEGMYTIADLEKILQDFKAVKARMNKALETSMRQRP